MSSSTVNAFLVKQKQHEKKEKGNFEEKLKSHNKEEEKEVEQEQEHYQEIERRKSFSSSSSSSVQALTRLRTTTMWTLIFPPCLLFIFTLLSVWFLPSSYYYDFIHRTAETATETGVVGSRQEKYYDVGSVSNNKNPAKRSAKPSMMIPN